MIDLKSRALRLIRFWTHTCLLIGLSNAAFTQGVSINDTGTPPDNAAILDVSSTNKGFLPPRLSTTERDAMSGTLPVGLTIYNTSTHCMEVYDFGIWHSFGCATCPSPASPAAGVHSSSETAITWNWNVVAGADGYRYGLVNNYSLATDAGTSTTYTQSALTCGSSQTLYVWAYTSCANSPATQLTFSTASCPFTCGLTLTDARDGNTYPTLQLGSQCWMGKNLAYLPSVVGSSTGSNTDPYFYVNGYNGTNVTTAKATSNYLTYGVLYNWPAAMQGAAPSTSSPSGVQGICPAGWHLPSNNEWITLANTYGGIGAAGGPLKEAGLSHWNSPNYGATNTSQFTGLPGGARDSNGAFSLYPTGFAGIFWNTGQETATEGTGHDLYFGGNSLGSFTYLKQFGFSVRCIKD
jgi:uncharacterized protein (TIGR02145 family)